MSSASAAVFLSYASQDVDAARRICESLRGAGVEVWFDQNQLVGGDAWDAKIRGQIGSCALFVPIISANTQARGEGYFRLEWKLAVDRSHLMAHDQAFLLPVVIDGTSEPSARVPAEFRAVQWSRLPDGETSAPFCERVKRLLDGEVTPAFQRRSHRSNAPHRLKAGATLDASRRRRTTSWLMASAAAFVLVAFAVWWPWKNRPAPEAKPTAPLTEARKLTLQARALIDDDWLAGRENFRLAEELCQRATTLDPTDGEAWATAARVSAETGRRRYDIMSARLALARSHTERAIRLAPESVESGLALAAHLASKGDLRVESRLRDLHTRAPQDPRVLLMLAKVLNFSAIGKDAEATEIRLHHPAFAGRDPRPLVDEGDALHIRGRFAEAETLVDRAHALAPTLEGYYKKLLLLTQYLRDKDATRLFIEQLPTQVLLEDAFASQVARFYIRLGESDKALALLRRVPRDFFEEKQQVMPKGIHAGWAQQIAGRTTAAQAEWKHALSVVEKRIVVEPNHPELLHWKAHLQALTGERDEAERSWKLLGELMGRPEGQEGFRYAEFHLALGRHEEAVQAVQLIRSFRRSSQSYNQASSLLYDPWFEPIRKYPAVQQLIAEEEERLQRMWQDGTNPTSQSASSSTPFHNSQSVQADKSVAVLAFANIPDDKSNEYFSDGISEELLNVLAKIPGLKVTARTSAFHFKGRNTPIPEIAKQLGVAYVVEGSVRKIGTQLRIAARLLKGTDGTQVWADDFREELKDVFALQDKIAGHIAKNLALTLGTSGPVSGVPTSSLTAYDAYLRGRALHTSATSFAARQSAIRHYEEAVRIDANYALAWAQLSKALMAVREIGYDRSNETPSKAQAAAATALRLAPDSPDAHVAMATVRLFIDHDLDATQRELDEAERLRPNDADATLLRARLERARGHWGGNELARLITRVVALDPQNAVTLNSAGAMFSQIGRYAEADQMRERSWKLSSQSFASIIGRSSNYVAWTGDAAGALAILKTYPEGGERNQLFYLTRARLRVLLGDVSGALADYEKVLLVVGDEFGPRERRLQALFLSGRIESRRGNATRAATLYAEALELAQQFARDFPGEEHAYLAQVHAARGEKVQALKATDEAMRRATRLNDAFELTSVRIEKAEVLALLGETDAAIAELQALHKLGRAFGYTLRLNLTWQPLRDHPKFQQLMKEAEARANAQPRPQELNQRR